jgi:hypothetical protein
VVVERTEAEGSIQDNVLRRPVCLGGKKLLHLDLWRCDASVNTSSVRKRKWIRNFSREHPDPCFSPLLPRYQ